MKNSQDQIRYVLCPQLTCLVICDAQCLKCTNEDKEKASNDFKGVFTNEAEAFEYKRRYFNERKK